MECWTGERLGFATAALCSTRSPALIAPGGTPRAATSLTSVPEMDSLRRLREHMARRKAARNAKKTA
jgi:hypothetical protein